MKGLELCKFGLCPEGEETLEGPGTVGCSRRTAVRKLGWGLEACRGRGRWRVLPHHGAHRTYSWAPVPKPGRWPTGHLFWLLRWNADSGQLS